MSEEVMTNSDDLDWDNNNFQKLRLKMLNGKWDKPGCDNCRMKEEIGAQSQRQNWLKNTIKKFPKDAYDNPQIKGNTVRHLFLNFNNVCNFKCRMCSPRYSNSLIPERKKLVDEHVLPHYEWTPELYKNINNTVKFLEANKHKLKDIRSIWITGGEPFIDKTIWQVLDILNEYANPSQISMSITNNGSRVTVDDLKKFSHFKQIHFDLSMDTPGPMFEYMRSAGVFTWEQFDKFVTELAEYRKDNEDWLLVSLNSTFQIYNATMLKELHEYTYEKLGPGHVNCRVLMGPRYFKASCAPDSVKELGTKKAQELLTYDWLEPDERSMINDCIKMLNTERNENYWEVFKKMCIAQDKYRGVHLKDYDPLLAREIYDDIT